MRIACPVSRRALPALLAALPVLAACDPAEGQGPVTTAAPDRTVTEAENGGTIPLRVGQSIRLLLPETAGTGYRWAVAEPYPALVTVAEGPLEVPAGAPPGAAGRAPWVLTARAPGRNEVALKLWRPWEGDRSVVRRFQITLVIAP